MARINVSVPDELKVRMDSLGNVNWSEVAQAAFSTRAQIEELKMGQHETAEIDAGLVRLRASQEASTEEEIADGTACGRTWALKLAGYRELRRVVRLADDETLFDGQADASWLVARAACNDERLSARDLREFWEHVGDSPEPSDSFVEGFLDGAVEVFEKL